MLCAKAARESFRCPHISILAVVVFVRYEYNIYVKRKERKIHPYIHTYLFIKGYLRATAIPFSYEFFDQFRFDFSIKGYRWEKIICRLLKGTVSKGNSCSSTSHLVYCSREIDIIINRIIFIEAINVILTKLQRLISGMYSTRAAGWSF